MWKIITRRLCGGGKSTLLSGREIWPVCGWLMCKELCGYFVCGYPCGRCGRVWVIYLWISEENLELNDV